MASFSIASFNLNGLNQREDMARHICDTLDVNVIFIQESWLTADLYYKLCNINADFIMFGISVMAGAVTKGPLTGRPFGGLATFIHNKYKNYIVNHICSERLSIISILFLILQPRNTV